MDDAPPPVEAIAGDGRFFARSGPFSVSAIAAAAGGVAESDDGRMLAGMAQLQVAGPTQLSFLDNRRYADALSGTRAGCVLVHPEMRHRVPAGCVPIVMKDPRVGWARVAALFHPQAPPVPGVDARAAVDPTARIDPTAEIGPFAVVGAGAEIGPRCRIGPGAVIGPGVVLGRDCRIGPQASLSHTLAGARVYVYSGARIGQEGFGFEITPTGMLSVPQLGRVILEDDVEVGANTTIDRGSIGDTVIGAGSRLDNLVQIGHNVRLGRCCVVVSQVGISGSTVVEDFVMFGGQAGITGHLHIGRGAKVGAQAGVMADVPAGASVLGSPAVLMRDALKQFALVKRMVAARSAAKADRSDTD